MRVQEDSSAANFARAALTYQASDTLHLTIPGDGEVAHMGSLFKAIRKGDVLDPSVCSRFQRLCLRLGHERGTTDKIRTDYQKAYHNAPHDVIVHMFGMPVPLGPLGAGSKAGQGPPGRSLDLQAVADTFPQLSALRLVLPVQLKSMGALSRLQKLVSLDLLVLNKLCSKDVAPLAALTGLQSLSLCLDDTPTMFDHPR